MVPGDTEEIEMGIMGMMPGPEDGPGPESSFPPEDEGEGEAPAPRELHLRHGPHYVTGRR